MNHSEEIVGELIAEDCLYEAKKNEGSCKKMMVLCRELWSC